MTVRLLIPYVLLWTLSGGPAVDRTSQSQSLAVTYRVTFTSTWSAATHPTDFPSNPHFSGLIGATHSSAVTFWEPGGIAGQGIENMAETGSKTALSAEIDTAIGLGSAQFLLSGGGISRSPGEVVLEFGVSEAYSGVTLVSMLAPSPDWFVGVSGLDLYEGGVWAVRVEAPLIVYDAGTDSGTTYTSPNANTDPQEVIAELTAPPFDAKQQVGVFVFDLVGTTAVEENGPARRAGFDAYPLPVRDRLWVEHEEDGPVVVEVTDLLGRTVVMQRGVVARRIYVDISGWAAGVYIVTVTGGGRPESRPVAIVR